MSTTTTTTERLPHRQVIDNVWKLAPSWGGTLSADEDQGYASFTKYVDVGDFGGAPRCSVDIEHMVEFDPDTGKLQGEPCSIVEVHGLDDSVAYLPLAALPKLLNALGELAAAGGMVAEWKDGQQYR